MAWRTKVSYARVRQELEKRSSTKDGEARHGAYWRDTVRTGTGVAAAVLIINIAVLGWVENSRDVDDGVASVYEGSCDQMGVVFTCTHLVINILSTLLLATSNACMQCLTAPTREEVDAAHAKHRWLDIGVTSPRNILRRGANNWRRLLWVCLALTSVPLHLFYNSILFTSPAASDLLYILVAPEFLDGASFRSAPMGQDFSDYHVGPDPIGRLQRDVQSLKHLSTEDCVKAYRVPVQEKYQNVLLVSDYQTTDKTANDTVIYVMATRVDDLPTSSPMRHVRASDWTYRMAQCNNTWVDGWQLVDGFDESDCEFYSASASDSITTGWYTPPDPEEESTPLTPVTVTVQYCLAEEMAHQTCSVDISTKLLTVVIVCNVVKLLCLLGTLFAPRFEPLVTVGDAIASFLHRADPHTQDQGLLSARDVRKGGWVHTSVATTPPSLRPFVHPGKSLVHTVGPWTWLVSIVTLTAVLVGGFAILGLALHWGFYAGTDPWSYGIGEINPELLITKTRGMPLLAAILLANAPQILISCAYVLGFNTVLTSMLLSKEYSSYACLASDEPADVAAEAAGTGPDAGIPLRVSKPVKGSSQIANWALSIPWAYAIPLNLAMVTLHFLVSQAIFVVRLHWTAGLPSDASYETTTALSSCGWSLVALVASIVLGIVIIASLAAITVFVRLRPGIPIAGSCSAALAAACHRRADDEGVELKEVRYGVLEKRSMGGKDVEHVGFGSKGARPLQDKVKYI